MKFGFFNNLVSGKFVEFSKKLNTSEQRTCLYKWGDFIAHNVELEEWLSIRNEMDCEEQFISSDYILKELQHVALQFEEIEDFLAFCEDVSDLETGENKVYCFGGMYNDVQTFDLDKESEQMLLFSKLDFDWILEYIFKDCKDVFKLNIEFDKEMEEFYFDFFYSNLVFPDWEVIDEEKGVIYWNGTIEPFQLSDEEIEGLEEIEEEF